MHRQVSAPAPHLNETGLPDRQNAVQDEIVGCCYRTDDGRRWKMKVTFGLSGDLPLLDSSGGVEPYYDIESVFGLSGTLASASGLIPVNSEGPTEVASE